MRHMLLRLRVVLAIGLIALLSACDHVPSKEYKIQTVDGEVLTFSCPTIDEGRSKFSFIYSHDCYLVSR